MELTRPRLPTSPMKLPRTHSQPRVPPSGYVSYISGHVSDSVEVASLSVSTTFSPVVSGEAWLFAVDVIPAFASRMFRNNSQEFEDIEHEYSTIVSVPSRCPYPLL